VSFAELPLAVVWSWWGVLGLFVGSFLNVCIHRYPYETETVSRPRRSRCPSCKTTLTWRENIPLFSWLIQRGRCRTCRWPIPWRYPFVELLNAALWFFVATRLLPDDPALCALQCVVISGLIVASAVDFDCMEIPDQISIGGMLLAPVAALLLPRLHDTTYLAQLLTEGPAEHVSRFAALTACLAGMALGGGVLLAVGWFGRLAFGRDAMGLGDVKLLAAGGGLIGPGGVVVALMIAALVASVVGVGNIARLHCLIRSRARQRGGRRSFGRALGVARVAGAYLPFGPYLALGVGIALVAWKDVEVLLRH